MNDHIFIKIITLADLDEALNNTAIYERVKNTLFMLLRGGEALVDASAQLVVEDKALNDAFCKLLETAKTLLITDLEHDALEETLNKIKKDYDLYKELYNYLNLLLNDDDDKLDAALYPALYDARILGTEFVPTVKRASLDDDKLDAALDAALYNARNVLFSNVESGKNLHTEALKKDKDNVNYYPEVSKVLNWLSFEYCQSADATKKFIKKHIHTIIESNHPNKTLERLQLLHFAQLGEPDSDKFKKFLDTSLEHLEAFKSLIGDSSSKDLGYRKIENIVIDKLNQKNIRAFIENPTLSSLKIIREEPSEPISFFMFLSALWQALVNRNNNSQGLIERVVTVFEETKTRNNEYKTYQKELLESIKECQKNYNSELDKLRLKILDEKEEVKSDIDFKALAKDLCTLSYFYCSGMTIAKRNSTMDKFFQKFNYPNKVDPIVKGKLEVLFWIYEGYYGNMNIAEKNFIGQHLDKIMDCNRPKEALNALCLIFFYKLHDKTNTNDIIEAILKNHSPESFIKEFISELVSMNIAKKNFIGQHLDNIMDCNRPKKALSALYLIFSYKLHDKTNTNDIIEAILKNHSPESFIKKFISKLVPLNKNLNLIEEEKISSVLDTLLVQCSQSSKTSANEATDNKIQSQSGLINRTGPCLFYVYEERGTLKATDDNNNYLLGLQT